MATINYVSLENLTRYDGKMKEYIDSAKTKALKSVAVVNNKINFYVETAPEAETAAAFSVDMPVEYFLDQAKTVLVQSFVYAEETYPGSTDPSLDGKPVLVLAVKGDDGSVTYSFLNLESLVKIYEGGETDTVTVEVDGDTNEIKATLKVSAAEGNILSVKEDGLYAEAILDISGKADKLVNPEGGDAIIKEGQILVDDGAGNLDASGKTIAELSNDILGNIEAISEAEIDNLFA